jgi:hypothetical protein
MIVRAERYLGYHLVLKKFGVRFQVSISDLNHNLVALSDSYTDGGSALGQARSYVDALLCQRKRW